MPMPIPKTGEKQDDFIKRCMSNKDMKEEFPDNDQRLAVCFSQWKKKKKSGEDNLTEKRTYGLKIEIRAEEDGSKRLKGHAAIFNEYVKIGRWFEERIMPGAFKQAIKQDDVRALFNHDANFILGRNVAGTLAMEEDKTGLAVDIAPPDTQLVRDLVLAPIERGDISQMSFAFQVIEEKWAKGKDDEFDKRDIIKVKLFDVSPVTYPAYEGTDIALASRSKAFEHTDVARTFGYGNRLKKVNLKLKEVM